MHAGFQLPTKLRYVMLCCVCVCVTVCASVCIVHAYYLFLVLLHRKEEWPCYVL